NLGVDVNLRSVNVSLYWQNIYEDGPVFPMYKAYNVEDGLWGVSVKLKNFQPLNRFVLEYMSTTDQSGPWHDLDGVIYGGTDNYYNNGVYPNGWTFYGMTVGNPWLTSPKYNENGSVSVFNNKVRLYYAAGIGRIRDIDYKATFAYSDNWGSPFYTYESSKGQFSYQLEASKPLPSWKNTKVSIGISGDRGKMYGNNFALLFGISYSGNFSY
ncbi:MAG: capsule assembly Wzi family protein, partial [Bacteroidales bacterium]|nr:capsule assembly Wzi family protein [Bacteroidales bacterium]MDD3908107.1 capsule assembly Wzi family protein [Bacteroidales bacterium]